MKTTIQFIEMRRVLEVRTFVTVPVRFSGVVSRHSCTPTIQTAVALINYEGLYIYDVLSILFAIYDPTLQISTV